MTLTPAYLYTDYMPYLPLRINFVLFALFGLSILFFKPNLAHAQSATDSATATGSAAASSSATASPSAKGGYVADELPDELPESGSNDALVLVSIGGFLILSGLMGRVVLANLIHEA